MHRELGKIHQRLWLLALLAACGARAPQPAQVPPAPSCERRPSAAERTCSDASECAVLEVRRDCCGSLLATGIRADQKARVELGAAQCSDAFGLCECVAQPTRCDDDSVVDESSTLRVSCVNALCTTQAQNASTAPARSWN